MNSFASNDSAWTAGKRGRGMTLDGLDDYVKVNNTSKLYLRSNFSIFAWLKTTDTSAAIVSWGSSGTGGVANGQYGLGRFNAGGAGLNTFIGGSWRSGSTFIDGNWHHGLHFDV
jgi:hypothetical protein